VVDPLTVGLLDGVEAERAGHGAEPIDR
jgi:hypothetical protein